jgi:hypothetical protein
VTPDEPFPATLLPAVLTMAVLTMAVLTMAPGRDICAEIASAGPAGTALKAPSPVVTTTTLIIRSLAVMGASCERCPP